MATERICPSCGSEIKQGSDYCLMCGTVYDGSIPAPQHEETGTSPGRFSDSRIQGYALRMLRRSRILSLLLALCLVLLAAAGIYTYSLSKRQSNIDSVIAALNSEIQSLSAQNAQLSSENDSLCAENVSLEAKLETLLGDSDGALKLDILNTVIDFQNRRGSDNVRFADYGADRSIIFLHIGETAQLRVHFDYTDSLLYWALEKENIVSPEWGNAWVGTTCPLMLTGLNAGSCEIMFGSDYSEDVFYVLCVVLP